MKKKLLFIGISMNCGGTEKAFLSFARALDYSKYDVTLLLAMKSGPLLSEIPPEIKVIEMKRYGEMFALNGESAISVIKEQYIKQNPLTAFTVFPYWLKMKLQPEKKHFIAMRLWCALMQKMPEIEGVYDAACAFWGDKTMFYMVDKVKATKKIAWLHFDYGTPPREDALYLKYFQGCDALALVSKQNCDELKKRMPEIANHCHVVENVIETDKIISLAGTGETFDDKFTGVRILSVGRLSYQKGFDMAVEAVSKLVREGFDIKYYIIGGGSDREALKTQAKESSVGDRIVFLGEKSNPYAYMRDCGIYLQSSRFEGKPLTVEEAMIFCRPIVATEYGSALSQLGGGKYGLVCPISADGIAKALRSLLESSVMRGSLISALSSREPAENGVQVFNKLVEGRYGL